MQNSTDIVGNITSDNGSYSDASTEGPHSANLYNDPLAMKICFGIIGVIGGLGNTLVVCVFMRKSMASSTGLSSTNIFILNQSVIDLVSSILLIVNNLIVITYVTPGLGGDILCKLWVNSKYPMWACFLGSTFNLVGLTLERYSAIVHPISHHTKFTPKKAKIMAIAVWPFCFTYELHWALVHASDGRGGCIAIFYDFLPILGIIVLIFQYLIPLFIMVFSYVAILRVVRRQSRVKPGDEVSLENGGANASQQPQQLSRTEKNVIMTLLIVVVMYIICWSPNQIYYFFFNLGISSIEINGVFFQYTVVSVCCNMCINPFIYAAKLKDFREEAVKILTCGKLSKPAFLVVNVQ